MKQHLAPLRSLFQKAYLDTFLRHNAIYFIGSMIVAALNYAYYPVLSRIVSIQNFGDLGTVISLIGQAGIIFGIFNQVARHTIIHSKHDAIEDQASIQSLYSTALLSIGCITLLLLIFSGHLTSVFHFQSGYTLPAFAVLILLNVPATFLQATLLAKLNFKMSSIASALMALGRLFFAIILIELGLGVAGAIIGLMLSQIAFISYAYRKAQLNFSLLSFEWPRQKLFKDELPYALLVFLSTGLVSVLYNSDIIAVKYFFPATAAGLYVGISTIANILYFVTASISGVLLSHVNRHTTFKNNHTTMIKALLLTLFIGGSSLIFFSLFPSFMIKLLIGEKYLAYGQYLAPLSILIFLVSLVNLFISFFISLREFRLMPLCMIGLTVFAGSVFFFHTSISSIIIGYTIATSISLLLLVGFYVYYWSLHAIDISPIIHENN